jgi:cytochrome c oxidase subunit 4
MSDHNTHALAEEHHPLGDNLLLKVYTALIILTGITVAASVLYPGKIGIAVATVVTPLKAALILMFFMHLRYEKRVFVIMFLVAVAILAIVMGLTFFDYLYR